MERFLKKMVPIRLLHLMLRVYLFIDRRERFAVSGFIFYKNKILLVRHSYGSSDWTPPGGFIKKGEDPEGGLRREIKEEVGLDLLSVKLMSVDSDVRPHHNVTVYRFYAHSESERCIIDELEIKDARWFGRDEINELPISKDPYLKRAIAYNEQHVTDQF